MSEICKVSLSFKWDKLFKGRNKVPNSTVAATRMVFAHDEWRGVGGVVPVKMAKSLWNTSTMKHLPSHTKITLLCCNLAVVWQELKLSRSIKVSHRTAGTILSLSAQRWKYRQSCKAEGEPFKETAKIKPIRLLREGCTELREHYFWKSESLVPLVNSAQQYGGCIVRP